MIIPLYLIPAQTRASLETGLRLSDVAGLELPDLGMPIAGPVDFQHLQAFHALMQAQGLRLQPTRMLYDRLYAFERLAEAHASASPALRDMAIDLFERYQSAGEWIGLMH